MKKPIHPTLVDREQKFNARVARGVYRVMKDGKLLASASSEEAAQRTANAISGATVIGPKPRRKAA